MIFIGGAYSQPASDSVTVVKGSYLHYGHAYIEDNSMFLEEAFNQGSGVVQFISGTLISDHALEASFEFEIPLAGEKHQVSFGSSYHSSFNNFAEAPEGLGDIRVSYRPQLSGKHHWAMIIPRLTIAIPRKNTPDEFRYTQPDVELALAITKRLNRTFTSHLNVGTTYRFAGTSNKLFAYTFAGSVVWAIRPKFNFLLESVYRSFRNEIDKSQAETLINPAVRFSFPIWHYQVIPGLGAPVYIDANSNITPGLFLYLSIEPF
jgi:hypothetical protein